MSQPISQSAATAGRGTVRVAIKNSGNAGQFYLHSNYKGGNRNEQTGDNMQGHYQQQIPLPNPAHIYTGQQTEHQQSN